MPVHGLSKRVVGLSTVNRYTVASSNYECTCCGKLVSFSESADSLLEPFVNPISAMRCCYVFGMVLVMHLGVN